MSVTVFLLMFDRNLIHKAFLEQTTRCGCAIIVCVLGPFQFMLALLCGRFKTDIK